MKFESRSLKYGYSNARVKAMKGLLLKPAFLDDLVRCGSSEAMIELLQRTIYKGHFAEESARYSGSELIELAASSSFAETVDKLLRITPESDKKVLQALLLKYGILNLKTIMHAKKLGKEYGEVKPHLFPAGGLTEDDIRRIMKSDDRGLYREIKRTELGRHVLAPSTARFSKRMYSNFSKAMHSVDAFMKMESVIDAYVYLLMDSAFAESEGRDVAEIRQIMKREIDAKNIMIIERLKKHGRKKIHEHLIHGGTLSEVLINRIIESKDLAQTINLVKAKFRKLELAGEDLSDLEIAFEKAIAAQKTLAFHRGMLSVGVIIGLLLLKEEEVNNLRKIAKAKEFGIPEKEVREMLVVV